MERFKQNREKISIKPNNRIIENYSQIVSWSNQMKTNRLNDGNKDRDGSSPCNNVHNVEK